MTKEVMKRDWTPRETRMVSEYVTKYFPGKQARFQVRLGAVPTELTHEGQTETELALLRVWNRWADAVVIEDNVIHIIEAKIRPKLGPLEQLQLYERLFPHTPEFFQHARKRIVKHFIYAVEDPVLNVIAREQGILAQQYVPEWVPDYLKILQHRERRAPLNGLVEEG